MKAILFLFLMLSLNVFSQKYTIEQDDMGHYFPKVNNRLITNIAIDKKNNGKIALIVQGKAITPYKYDLMWLDEWKKFVIVAINEPSENSGKSKLKYGVIDKMGTQILPCEYDVIWDVGKEIHLFKGEVENDIPQKGKWAYMNLKGNIFIPCTLDYIRVEDFQRGYAKVLKGIFDFEQSKYIGHYGFIDSLGKEVVPCVISTEVYSEIGVLSDGMINVCKSLFNSDGFEEKRVGFVDMKGEIVIPTIYDKSFIFYKGMCHVNSLNRKICGCGGLYIDKKGNKVTPKQKQIDEYYNYVFEDK